MGFESRVGSVSPMCRWFWMYEEGYLADLPGIFYVIVAHAVRNDDIGHVWWWSLEDGHCMVQQPAGYWRHVQSLLYVTN